MVVLVTTKCTARVALFFLVIPVCRVVVFLLSLDALWQSVIVYRLLSPANRWQAKGKAAIKMVLVATHRSARNELTQIVVNK